MTTSQIYRLFAVMTTWLGFAQPSWSQGTISYFQPTSPILLHTEFFTELYPLDFDGDGIAELTFGYDFHFIGVRPEGFNRVLIVLSPPPNVGGPVMPLSAGFNIGADSGEGGLAWAARSSLDPFLTLVQSFDSGSGGAFVGQHAYMGVEFERAGNTYYGWVLLQISEFGAFGSIDAWAWDTRPGAPILAGAVPEPSSWTLLALGAVTLLFAKRK